MKHGALRVVVGTARAGTVRVLRRAGIRCPNGAPGTILDVVRDWRGLPRYVLVSDTGALFFLDAAALVRAQE